MLAQSAEWLLWLRASTNNYVAYTNWLIKRQISFNHAGYSVLVRTPNVVGFLLVR
jgi:hypothetical protein